ncbi:MAG: prepilin-type N-terminal cleavage/methylation domain-containing protein [Pirellulales bacterium]|nr:prepilin-type N-terminal cleavage/methylation domain-containing protein [Pirellulales bacterium]
MSWFSPKHSPLPLAGEGNGTRHGFSLLEVILALAILTGAIAVLGELARVALDSARRARDTTYAQLLCRSKMAEITSGAYHPEAVSRVPLGTSTDPGWSDWLYSIELAPTDQDGLIVVRVTVEENLPPEKRPVRYSLTQWMIDPDYEFTQAEGETEETTQKKTSREEES